MVVYKIEPADCRSQILFAGKAQINATRNREIPELTIDPLAPPGYQDVHFATVSLHLKIGSKSPEVKFVPHPFNNPSGEWSLWRGDPSAGHWVALDPLPSGTATNYLRLRNTDIRVIRDDTDLLDGKSHAVGLKGLPDDGAIELYVWAEAASVVTGASSCHAYIEDFQRGE
ncbi:hypothetical protein [Kitasatospora arboriphila]|uniref:Uncharacterized protein n=1 Tax=Kitasatospora arboriphila TaxID=258052 RepID=A0ABP4ESB1_9ACTN